MSKLKDLKIYIIRHKESGKHWSAPSGKSSWRAIGHAKNAWATLCHSYGSAEYYGNKYGVELVPTGYRCQLNFPKFDEQNVYEVVEVNNLAGELVGDLQSLIKQLIEFVPEDKKAHYLQQYKELVNE